MASPKQGPDTSQVRLNKYLAVCGLASRRKADEMISSGQVQVNGKTVYELGVRVEPGIDRVVVDGKTVELGSFNYSDAAAHRNSENVLVNWDNEKLAQVYLGPFSRNYAQATPYRTVF